MFVYQNTSADCVVPFVRRRELRARWPRTEYPKFSEARVNPPGFVAENRPCLRITFERPANRIETSARTDYRVVGFRFQRLRSSEIRAVFARTLFGSRLRRTVVPILTGCPIVNSAVFGFGGLNVPIQVDTIGHGKMSGRGLFFERTNRFFGGGE